MKGPQGDSDAKPRVALGDRGALRPIFRLLCAFAAYLVLIELLGDFLDLGRLLSGLLQFVPYCLVLGTVIYLAHPLVLEDKQAVLLGLCLACVFIVFFLNLTRALGWLREVPLVGGDSRVRNQISSLAIMVAIASFPAASYFMIEEVLAAKNQLDQQVEKLQLVEKELLQQKLELARLYEQTRQDAETKTELLREINHRVRNNLVSILGLIQTRHRHAPRQVDRPIVKAAFERVSQQVKGLIEVHEMLSVTQWRPVLLSDLAFRIITVVTGMIEPSSQVKVDVARSAILVSPRLANSIGLALNELATNSLKYATTGRALTAIGVSAESKGEWIEFEYRDDGPGFPAEVLHGLQQGVGLTLLKQLADGAFRGSLNLYNDHGAKVVLSIKNDEGNRT